MDQRAPLIGHVVDRHGAGVQGVCIGGFTFRGEGATVRTVTGKHGRFILDTTSPGTRSLAYTIDLRPCGTNANVAPEYYQHANGFEGSADVVVHAGHTTHKDFILRTGATLEGTVSSVAGRPLAGVCVRTAQWGESRGTGAQEVSFAVTNSQGSYRIRQLVPTAHRVLAWSSCGPDGVPLAASGGPTHLAEGGQPIQVGEGQVKRVDLSVAG